MARSIAGRGSHARSGPRSSAPGDQETLASCRAS
jgi:hypothetical protein